VETVRPCAGCHQPVEVTSPNRKWHAACYRRHKSDLDNARQKAQRAARPPLTCVDCGVVISRSGNVKYCSACAKRRSYAITNAWFDARRGPRKCPACLVCGADISARRSNTRYCLDCSRRRRRDRVSVHRAARRSQGWGFPKDVVFRDELFARDNYTCHICGKPTSLRYTPSDPLSPVVDHLIPLVLPETPGHVWENAACAHRFCNAQKRDRVRAADWDLYRRLCRRKHEEA
jgi:5-methylcytosine-specific restriction endonuclease McrA